MKTSNGPTEIAQRARSSLHSTMPTPPTAAGLQPRSQDAAEVLRAACRLNPPWAFRAGGRLVGLDVFALERYAALTGRVIAWQVCDSAQIDELLRAGRVQLAVGGLSDSSAPGAGVSRLLASSRRLRNSEAGGAADQRHVWLIGALGAGDRWRLKAFLLWRRLNGFGRR